MLLRFLNIKDFKDSRESSRMLLLLLITFYSNFFLFQHVAIFSWRSQKVNIFIRIFLIPRWTSNIRYFFYFF